MQKNDKFLKQTINQSVIMVFLSAQKGRYKGSIQFKTRFRESKLGSHLDNEKRKICDLLLFVHNKKHA